MVAIASPTDGATVYAGKVTITADAQDFDGLVTQVEFFDGATSLGVDTTSPYSVDWTAASGSHTLTAKATDDGPSPRLQARSGSRR